MLRFPSPRLAAHKIQARRGKEKGGDTVMYEALAFNSVGLMM